MMNNNLENLDTPLTSQFYWLWRNLSNGFKSWAGRNKTKFAVLSIVLFLLLFLFRAALHPYVLLVRINFFPILLGLAMLALALWLWRRERRIVGGIVAVTLLAGVVAFLGSKGRPRDYLGLYWHYQTVDKVEIDQLPITSHERIQPLNSIRALAGEAMTEVEQTGEPGFVRHGDNFFWTMAVEPSYTVSRITGKAHEILEVSATAPSPNFSQDNRSPVSFLTGEQLLFSRNARVASINRFGPWKYLNYEPKDVRYVRGEGGEWVQVITLVRWKGLIFPRPVFGGVLVVEQRSGSVVTWLANAFLGSGRWIPAADVGQHDYLRGQNIVPADASRFTAESFRFQKGFLAPLPGYHIGDVRIPDLPGDYNDQPFTAYFEFEDGGKLFHYFALEPFQEGKQGLNTSVFAPADGIGPVRVFRHHERGDALTGVSAIVAKVMESRKVYDWERNSAAEQRPFIRDIGGKRRFFWLTTVVTFKDDQSNDRSFIAGSTPDVTLTDALYKAVVWVDARKPHEWERQLESELAGFWLWFIVTRRNRGRFSPLDQLRLRRLWLRQAFVFVCEEG